MTQKGVFVDMIKLRILKWRGCPTLDRLDYPTGIIMHIFMRERLGQALHTVKSMEQERFEETDLDV